MFYDYKISVTPENGLLITCNSMLGPDRTMLHWSRSDIGQMIYQINKEAVEKNLFEMEIDYVIELLKQHLEKPEIGLKEFDWIRISAEKIISFGATDMKSLDKDAVVISSRFYKTVWTKKNLIDLFVYAHVYDEYDFHVFTAVKQLIAYVKTCTIHTPEDVQRSIYHFIKEEKRIKNVHTEI